MLYIVSTPIGNLNDITLRALDILENSDAIVCEDTRQTMKLLNKYNIKKQLLSFHSHSSSSKIEGIIKLLQEGKSISLVTDAGTPGISDPGYLIVSRAVQENIQIIPIPGASAFLTALQASGLPINEFTYLGFLPHKKGRATLLKTIAEEKRTVVFYESPYRILKTLQSLTQLCPHKKIVVGRELTKVFEEFFRGTVKEALHHFTSKKVQGEFVIIVS